MHRILSGANKIMPLAFLALAAMAITEFWLKHGPGGNALGDAVHRAGMLLQRHGWIVLACAALAWLLVLLVFFHERHGAAHPAAVEKKGRMMDILDRLSNRRILEEKLTKSPSAVFIDAEQLATALKSKVIGQDDVCDDIAAQIRRRLALKQRSKPIGVFMLAGPPGTGKTYLAKCLAAQLQRKLLHFDMTQFSGSGHGASQLFGSAKGYVGSDSYGKLTGGLRDVPDAVVLLDEIEKAHPDVHKNFLTAWNDGFVTEASDGKQVATTGAIFIMTTNAATDALQSLAATHADFPDELRRATTNVLREAGFAAEVLNRIDRIFTFKPLSGLNIARVTALEIEAMIKAYELDVSTGGIDPDVLIDMMRRQERLGAAASSRDLVRAIEESISDSLIDAKQNGYTKVALYSEGDAVFARPVA